MKCINQNKKRLASVSRSKKPVRTQKNYIAESKNAEKQSKEKLNDKKIDIQPKPKNKDSSETKVSPEVIRTTFDSIKVYLENMKAFYLNEAEKLNDTVKKIDQNIEFVIPRK